MCDYLQAVSANPADAEETQTRYWLVAGRTFFCRNDKCVTHSLRWLSKIRQDGIAWPQMPEAGPLKGNYVCRASVDRISRILLLLQLIHALDINSFVTFMGIYY